MLHILYNTTTETLECYSNISPELAEEYNDELRAHSESHRWIPVVDDEDVDCVACQEQPVPYTS